MSHRKIWIAIRELEDQQARDNKRVSESIEGLAQSAHIEADLRQAADSTLASHNKGLRKGQSAIRDAIADIRFQFNAMRRPLEHRVSLQDQADLLQESIGELTERNTDREKEIAHLCQRVFDLENDPAGHPGNVLDIEAAQAAHDKQELDRLVDYIRSELPDGTAGMDETVTDTAIRLLKTYRVALQDILKTEIVDGLLREPSVTAYRIAWTALKGEDND